MLGCNTILHKGIGVAGQPALLCGILGGRWYRDGESHGHGLDSQFAVVPIRKIRELGNMFLERM